MLYSSLLAVDCPVAAFANIRPALTESSCSNLTKKSQLVQHLRTHVRTAVARGNHDAVAELATVISPSLKRTVFPLVVVAELAHAIHIQREPTATRMRELKELVKGDTTERRQAWVKDQLSAAKHEYDAMAYAAMPQLVNDVICHAGQIADMYSYTLSVFEDKRKVPMPIKRGVATAFNKFTAEDFSQRQADSRIRFCDVLRMVHPTAKDYQQGQVFHGLIKNAL